MALFNCELKYRSHSSKYVSPSTWVSRYIAAAPLKFTLSFLQAPCKAINILVCGTHTAHVHTSDLMFLLKTVQGTTRQKYYWGTMIHAENSQNAHKLELESKYRRPGSRRHAHAHAQLDDNKQETPQKQLEFDLHVKFRWRICGLLHVSLVSSGSDRSSARTKFFALTLFKAVTEHSVTCLEWKFRRLPVFLVSLDGRHVQDQDSARRSHLMLSFWLHCDTAFQSSSSVTFLPRSQSISRRASLQAAVVSWYARSPQNLFK